MNTVTRFVAASVALNFFITYGQNSSNYDGKPLIEAAAKGDIEKLNSLIGGHARVGDFDSQGRTAIMWAAIKGHADCLKALISAGGNVNSKMNCKLQALELCVAIPGHYRASLSRTYEADIERGAGNVECINALIHAGAAVDARDEFGYTALMEAASSGRPDCVKALIEGGANVNETSNLRMTALELAVCPKSSWTVGIGGSTVVPAGAGNLPCVRLLLDAKAKIDIKDDNGDTALSSAAGADYDDCVKALIGAGSSLNSKNKQGNTPLMEAVIKYSVSSVKALIAAHADLNIRNRHKKTALMLADSADVRKLLLDAGAKEG